MCRPCCLVNSNENLSWKIEGILDEINAPILFAIHSQRIRRDQNIYNCSTSCCSSPQLPRTTKNRPLYVSVFFTIDQNFAVRCRRLWKRWLSLRRCGRGRRGQVVTVARSALRGRASWRRLRRLKAERSLAAAQPPQMSAASPAKPSETVEQN
jgi:hypothetical protein